jgi:hypothetical protein
MGRTETELNTNIVLCYNICIYMSLISLIIKFFMIEIFFKEFTLLKDLLKDSFQMLKYRKNN